MRTYKFETRDLLSWRLPKKEPCFGTPRVRCRVVNEGVRVYSISNIVLIFPPSNSSVALSSGLWKKSLEEALFFVVAMICFARKGKELV